MTRYMLIIEGLPKFYIPGMYILGSRLQKQIGELCISLYSPIWSQRYSFRSFLLDHQLQAQIGWLKPNDF